MSAHRERLPETRVGETHKFTIKYLEDETPQEISGYITANTYPDGRVGEVFIRVDKEGNTIGGLLDIIGVCMSVGLQSGVPLSKFCEKLEHTRFHPSGMTVNKDIPFAKSLADYLAAWLGQTFLGKPSRTEEVEHG